MDAAERKPEVFTAAERQEFRADINQARRPGAYEPGKWSVSPLNRDPATVGVMPPRIRLRDITLRAIESLPGVVLTPAAKRGYLRQLAEAGVPDIATAGARGRGAEELKADVDLIKSVDPDRRVTCPLVLTANDLKAAAGAGCDAVQIWSPPWGVASRMYEAGVHAAAWSGEDWRHTLGLPADRNGFVARAASLVETARELGLEVTVPLLMVSYLDVPALLDTCRVLEAAGASEIALFDGPGAMAPEALGRLVEETKQNFPHLTVGVHAHNTFGMAVGAAVAAARSGAEVIEVSVNGYCGGPGNPDLASVTAAFEAVYGVSTGIQAGALKALSRAGEELTGYRIAYNHPVTGDRVYNWGGMDFLTQEATVDPLLHNAIAPAWSGAEVTIPVTEASGPFTLWDKLTELGLAPTRGVVDTALPKLKQAMRERQRLLTDAEIAAIGVEAGAKTR